MYRLIVKNFGVLKDIDIELNKTNLFIGENSSGKSILAKVITIVTSFDKYSNNLLEDFVKLDIDFFSYDTSIEFIDMFDEHIMITIKNKNISFSNDVLKTISDIDKTKDIFNSFENPNNIEIDDILPKKFTSQYIPAERNLISLLSESIFSLITAEIPLPKHLLGFGAHFEKAKNDIKELNILNIKYKYISGQDRVYYDKDNFLLLKNSSSGIQSVLPLYLTLKYFNKKHNNIIIEEPEQNLYPKAQVDTVKYVIENSSENLYLMTHSPYVLSTLNILLFSYKASNTNDKLKEKIAKIIPIEQQINPDEFSAYLIENGVSKSIKGDSTGMIKENVIDDVGDIIDDEFNHLMEIYREYKND